MTPYAAQQRITEVIYLLRELIFEAIREALIVEGFAEGMKFRSPLVLVSL